MKKGPQLGERLFFGLLKRLQMITLKRVVYVRFENDLDNDQVLLHLYGKSNWC